MTDSEMNGLKSSDRLKQEVDKEQGLTLFKFQQTAIKIHGNKYNYSNVIYHNSHKKVEIICPKHGSFFITPNQHLNGQGCHKCLMEKQNKIYNTDSFIEKAKQIHGNKYDYSKVEYKNSHTKVCIICKEHGEFWQTPRSHTQGNGCSYCNISKLELEIESLLKENHLTYEHNQFYDFLDGLQLDFYLPQYNIAIECQGRQHFEIIERWGFEKYERTIKNDNKKKLLCEKNNITLLYYSNAKLKYPYKVYENKEELIQEIYNGSK